MFLFALPVFLILLLAPFMMDRQDFVDSELDILLGTFDFLKFLVAGLLFTLFTAIVMAGIAALLSLPFTPLQSYLPHSNSHFRFTSEILLIPFGALCGGGTFWVISLLGQFHTDMVAVSLFFVIPLFRV